MRILSLNYEYPPIGGGGGNAHEQILREFTAFDDLDVTLVAPTLEPHPKTVAYSGNVRVELIPFFGKRDLQYWRRGEVIRYLWTHHRALQARLREERYDLCHAFFGFPTGMLAWLARKRLPYIVSVRGSDVPGYNKRFGLDYIVLTPLLRRIYGNARTVVANSEGLQALFERQFPETRARVTPNGVNTLRFRPIEKSQRDLSSIVAVARLIPRKGIDLLIHACGELHREGAGFECHIIGDGPEKNRLRQLAQSLGLGERIHFHGAMTRDALMEFLPRQGIFALPSYAEGMANAALEAMACGLPLALTETGGSRELIDGNGIIIPRGDAKRLSTVLGEWLRRPDLVSEMGVRSRARAEEIFSWANAARDYRDIYYQALASEATS